MIKIPPSFFNKIEIFVSAEDQHVHILELTDRPLSKSRIQSLIKQIAKYSHVSPIAWNWIYYGEGRAYGCSPGICSPLDKADPRLYASYRSKMYVAAPFRKL